MSVLYIRDEHGNFIPIPTIKIAINAGLMELEQVPEVYRNDVEEILKGE